MRFPSEAESQVSTWCSGGGGGDDKEWLLSFFLTLFSFSFSPSLGVRKDRTKAS